MAMMCFHGAGGHTMIGYRGNDTYYVNDVNDKVVEAAHGGSDKVFASVNFALSAGSEVELIATSNPSATAAINLAGNEFAQAIQAMLALISSMAPGGADFHDRLRRR